MEKLREEVIILKTFEMFLAYKSSRDVQCSLIWVANRGTGGTLRMWWHVEELAAR